jgi:3-hydroxyisobutyrate dehydrogenase-like beta-hydroxyacid dehydrogenase
MNPDPDPAFRHVGLVGYGEVGRILAEDLRHRDVEVSAYDVKLDPASPDQPQGRAIRVHAERHGVGLAADHADLAARADLVVSAVTANQAVPVARDCAPGIPPGAWFLDVNSASPGAKSRAAALVEAAGGRYVEGSVMTAVPPYRIAVPLLLGGPNAAAAQRPLRDLGFAATAYDERLGVASATKMCRSVVIKGMEALVVESLTAARAYGVEDRVVESLDETFPGIDWEKQAAYFFQRVIEHGRRRSEEMAEVAETVREAGLEPWSATATAQRQGWVADLADAGAFGPPGTPELARASDWRTEADRILSWIGTRGPETKG